MPSRRHHNAERERMSVAISARRAKLCAVAGHLCYLVASGLLRASCFSASFNITRYGLSHIGASCPMQTVAQNVHAWHYKNVRYLRPALTLGTCRCCISASSLNTRNQFNLLRNSTQQYCIRPSFGRPRSCSCSIACERRCRDFTSSLLRRK